jgi:hypothetical protein
VVDLAPTFDFDDVCILLVDLDRVFDLDEVCRLLVISSLSDSPRKERSA